MFRGLHAGWKLRRRRNGLLTLRDQLLGEGRIAVVAFLVQPEYRG
eukprot:CAMPEP_0119568610 /NCGR_PEP_ID=MMETSP1352-20130426/39390_1 /TAXON_ID=265584 /ORGANISM="Stauroneis constricta, Strain CCMP1120" /LENGTH=44 /DNA_ID= /DNA_START= /DNA_END= /DNA_ORIENTATION=